MDKSKKRLKKLACHMGHFSSYVVEYTLALIMLIFILIFVGVGIIPSIHNALTVQMIQSVPNAELTTYVGFVLLPTLFILFGTLFVCDRIYQKGFELIRGRFGLMRKDLKRKLREIK